MLATGRLREYKMSHARRGTAVIINNKHFKKMPTRTGTDVDADEMEKLFKYLGFDPIIRRDNLKANDIYTLLKDVSETKNSDKYKPPLVLKPHADADSFACAILSHGDEGVIFGADDMPVSISSITAHFKGDRCRSLGGKPKLFFIQACRGKQLDDGFEKADPYGSGEEQPARLPTESDFLMAYSTVPGYFSWRNGTHGSWFIQAVSDVFEEHKDKLSAYDLLRLMTLVSYNVAAKFQSKTNDLSQNAKKQMPCLMSMLTKEVYFRPDKSPKHTAV